MLFGKPIEKERLQKILEQVKNDTDDFGWLSGVYLFGRPLVIHEHFFQVFGLEGGIFMAKLFYEQQTVKKPEGEDWTKLSVTELENLTFMSYRKLLALSKEFVRPGLLNVRQKRETRETWYRLDITKMAIHMLETLIERQDEDSSRVRVRRAIDNNINTKSNKNTNIESTVTLSKNDSGKQEFSWPAYLDQMSKDKRRHIRLIALYWEAKNIRFTTSAAAEVAMKRHLRDASTLSKFSPDELKHAVAYRKEKYPNIDWTLGTLFKILTSVSTDELKEYS